MATRERAEIDTLLNAPYEISLVRRSDEDGGWVARVEELSGCEAVGESQKAALAALHNAKAAWITEALEAGKSIPPPKAAATHSGRLLVRMPPTMHAELARMADGEKVSLNTLIVGVLGGAVGWRHAEGESNGSDPNGSSRETLDQDEASGAPAAGRARLLNMALAVNLVVMLVAGLLAVGLLIAVLNG